MREAPSVAPTVTIAVDDAEFVHEPHKALARMRALGPIVWNRAIGMFVLTGREEVLHVLQSPSEFSSRRDVDTHEHLAPEARAVLARGYAATSILVNDDAPTHTRLRALVNRGFTRGAIAVLEPSIQATAEALVEPLLASSEADLVAGLAVPLPLTIICNLIGVDPVHAKQLKDWSRSWAALTHNRSLGAQEQVRCARDLVDWQRFMGELVEARRSEPRDDLLSRLVESREEGVEPLSTQEIAVFAMGLLFAGHETTANLIGNTIVNVLRHGLWERLAGNIELVPRAIEETLRFDPPVKGMLRRATQDVDIAGVGVPRGEQVLLSFASANRDPSRYPEPDRFDMDREEPLRHLGFGHGAHFCLGAELARLEVRAAVTSLVARKRAPRLVDDTLSYHPSLVHRGPAALKVSWRH
jgi:cytochrome P450